MKQNPPAKIAIIGCGEVGLSYARALSEHGQSELSLCEAAPSPALKDFAASAKLSIHPAPGGGADGMRRHHVDRDRQRLAGRLS